MKQLNKAVDRYYIFKIYDSLVMHVYNRPDDFTDFENGKFIRTKNGNYLICTIPKLINIVENKLNTEPSQRMLEIIANDFIYMVELSDITDPAELFTKLLRSPKQIIKIFKTELGI